ncbi:hypothetical protein EG68_09648 [Paragonimus skrjabini miyazakii]|uniref:Bromo domain-containing protein n=1 Tax=Paragonimus skrjabini miyazakii TaxID=59628 RepID=A0A8S9YMX1_9TREM|nr:hypothetical protein EG68_09648 [Paragonimus skrjabini miyazakii]
MDLGTISNRLTSRTCYKSVTDYLADVTLMCNNAMVYNPPDTIYYQRARKLQSFCRKQFTVSFLKKLCNQLGLKAGLTDAEIGESFLNDERQCNQFESTGSRRSRSCDNGLRSSSHLTPSSVDSPGKDWYLVTSSDSVTGSRLTMARSAVVGESGRVELTETNRHPLTTSTPDTSSKLPVKNSIQTQDTSITDRVSAPSASPVAEAVPNSDISIPPRRPRGRPRKIPKVIPIVTSSAPEIVLPVSPIIISAATSPSLTSTRVTRRFSHNSQVETSIDSVANTTNEVIVETSLVNVDNSPKASESNSYEIIPEQSSRSNKVTEQTHHSVTESMVVTTTVSPSINSFSSPAAVTKSSTNLLDGDQPAVQEFDHCLAVSIRKRKKRPLDASFPTKYTVCKAVKTTHERLSPIKPENLLSSKSWYRKRKKTKEVNDDSVTTSISTVTSPDSHAGSEETADSEPTVTKLQKMAVKCEEPEDEVLVQARQAAALAAGRLRAKYDEPRPGDHKFSSGCVGPRVIFVDTTVPNEVSAVECPKARSSVTLSSTDAAKPEETTDNQVHVNFSPIMVQCLARSRMNLSDKSTTGSEATAEDVRGTKTYGKSLIDPLTPEQLETLKQLDRLKYNPDEPISAAIHGPLAICFPKVVALEYYRRSVGTPEMIRFSDVYGCDLSVIEYAYSLLRFVEPMGRWARRWATKRLDAATDGMHSQLARFCQATALQFPVSREAMETDPSCPPVTNWLNSVGLTVDSPTPPSSPEPVMFAEEQEEKPLVSFVNCLLSPNHVADSQSVPVDYPESVLDPMAVHKSPDRPLITAPDAPSSSTSESVSKSELSCVTTSPLPSNPTADMSTHVVGLISTVASTECVTVSQPATIASLDAQPVQQDRTDFNATVTATPSYVEVSLNSSHSKKAEGLETPRPSPVVQQSIVKAESPLNFDESHRSVEDLTNKAPPATTAQVSLLKSALNAPVSSICVGDRPTPMLSSPLSAIVPELSSKLTCRAESLLQHSPQLPSISVAAVKVENGHTNNGIDETKPWVNHSNCTDEPTASSPGLEETSATEHVSPKIDKPIIEAVVTLLDDSPIRVGSTSPDDFLKEDSASAVCPISNQTVKPENEAEVPLIDPRADTPLRLTEVSIDVCPSQTDLSSVADVKIETFTSEVTQGSPQGVDSSDPL